MAEGRSNAAIAQQLVVSDGAVEKHVSNIFIQARPAARPRRPPARARRAAVARVMTTVAVPAPRYRGRPAWRILASILAIAALVWGTFNVVNLVAHSETRFTRTFPAAGIARVDVSTDRGSVRVIASDRDDVSLSAYVSNGLGGTDHAARVRGNRLLVDASCAVPVAYWCTASYTLRVPRDVKLVVWSGSGEVTVSGTTADVDLTTDHGSIDASRLRSQYAAASSQHGSIRLGFATAPMQVQASADARRRHRRGPPYGRRPIASTCRPITGRRAPTCAPIPPCGAPSTSRRSTAT